MDGISAVLALFVIIGFAIQQLLELLSGIVDLIIAKLCKNKIDPQTGKPFPAFKKLVMLWIASGISFGVVIIADISLLKYIDPSWGGTISDRVVSALVLGSGTEGMNTLTKYFGYVKDMRKEQAKPPVTIAVIPASVTVKVGQTFNFRAVVGNSKNQKVEWEVSHGSGGTVDDKGLYTAPMEPGTYQVVAISDVDQAKQAISKVTVTS